MLRTHILVHVSTSNRGPAGPSHVWAHATWGLGGYHHSPVPKQPHVGDTCRHLLTHVLSGCVRFRICYLGLYPRYRYLKIGRLHCAGDGYSEGGRGREAQARGTRPPTLYSTYCTQIYRAIERERERERERELLSVISPF